VALNVTNDLATFDHTVPCGIDGVEMSTVARECASLGVKAPEMAAMRDQVAHATSEVFSLIPASLPLPLRHVLD
jgi:lipoyl(octanoyl) transferase